MSTDFLYNQPSVVNRWFALVVAYKTPSGHNCHEL